MHSGGEGEGELRDREEIGGSAGEFQAVNGGYDRGEADVREEGFGAAAVVLSLVEFN